MSVAPEPLSVEVMRGDARESSHLVDVAVVDGTGAVVASAGEPDRLAAFRSSAKPLQAAVARAAGWAPSSDRALAIACSSHNGEAEHVAEVHAILDDAGLTVEALACPLDAPLYRPAALAAGREARITHNCSGKHASMLAACVAAGWPVDGYRAHDHPLQAAIREEIHRTTGGTVVSEVVDGCGVPTFVAPLAALARAFAAAEGTAEAHAMRAHPFLVGGTGRLDTALMESVPGSVAKGGAEALLCVWAGGFGAALKVRDGGARALGPALVATLAAVGVDAGPAEATHRAALSPPVLGGGESVGSLVLRGSLRLG